MNDGSHSAKMEAISSAENTPIIPKFITPICPIGPKVWDIAEKRLHWAFVSSPCPYVQRKREKYIGTYFYRNIFGLITKPFA